MWDRRPWSIGVSARGSRGGESLPCCELMSLCQKSSHIPWFFIASRLRKRCCTRLEGSFPLYPPMKLLRILLGPRPSPGALAPSFPRGRSYDSRHTSHSAGGVVCGFISPAVNAWRAGTRFHSPLHPPWDVRCLSHRDHLINA